MTMHKEQAATLDSHEEGVPLQTFRRSFAQIYAGEEPWLALGNFMHQFFGYRKHCRAELLREPIDTPENLSPEQLQWAVFCAASVEYLSKQHNIECPEWALDPRYTLEKPWYYDLNADLLEVQEELRRTTPEAFTRRNIFCGDRVYRNKYEHKGRQGRLRTA